MTPPAVTHVFLLMGQSNMAGRGVIEPGNQVPYPRLFGLGPDQQWRPAVEPLHFRPEANGVGPGLTFGRLVAQRRPKWTIGLVPMAKGGSSLAEWQPGGELYRDALRYAQSALRGSGRLAAALWHQGESDKSRDELATYVSRLVKLFQSLRADLSAPQLPVLVGELGSFVATAADFNRQLGALAGALSVSQVVSAAGLKDKGDGLHFDSASARELGRRYVEAFFHLDQ